MALYSNCLVSQFTEHFKSGAKHIWSAQQFLHVRLYNAGQMSQTLYMTNPFNNTS